MAILSFEIIVFMKNYTRVIGGREVVKVEIKGLLLLTIATEIKKTKLKISPAVYTNPNKKLAVNIDFPEALRKIDYKFGAIQIYSDRVELRFYFNALKNDMKKGKNLKDTSFFRTLDKIVTKPYRVKDRIDYLAFEFKEYDSSSISTIEFICKQLQEELSEFAQKKYNNLNNNFEELKCIFGLSIFKESMFKDLTMQEIIQSLKQQDFFEKIQMLEKVLINNFELEKGKGESYFQPDLELLQEIEKELDSPIVLESTERELIAKSRIGQPIFKKALLNYNSKCRLCGVTDQRFLIAGHIKQWSISNNQERLDGNNGLLLCPNHDFLFDKAYISFNDDGMILISEDLDKEARMFLNINENMSIRMNENQREYMKWHRERFNRKEVE